MAITKITKPKLWKPVEFMRPDLVSVEELLQGIYEDIHILQDADGVEYVKGSSLILPIVNKHGDMMNVIDSDGRAVTKINSHAYKNAAWEFGI